MTVVAGTVTVSPPTVNYVGGQVADGARVCLKHRQIFEVAASDINTSTDVIALGNDSNGDAPAFASSSPYSIAYRIALADGATMPTTSPQIVDGGSYRITISGGNAQLFVAEADISSSPITFSNAGTNNGSGELLTLRVETVLLNTVTSGGSGVSQALTLANGARVRRQGIHYSEAGGTTVTSIPFDDVFIWSSSAGISDSAEIDNTVNPWTLINNIAVATTISLSEAVTSNAGASVSSFSPDSTGSDAATNSGLTWALEGNGRVQINANDSDGLVFGPNLLHAFAYVYSTEAGIVALSEDTLTSSSVVKASAINLEVDNADSDLLQVVGTNVSGLRVSAATTGPVALNVATEGLLLTTSSGSGLDSTQSAQLTALYNTTTAGTGATVFSEAALANAPSGGGGSVDAQGVADALKLAPSAGDPAAGSVYDLLAAQFDPATDSVDVGSVGGNAVSDAFDPTTDTVIVGGYATGQSPATLVDLSGLATAADLSTVDTVVDAILEDTGTTLPATLSAIQGATFNTATDSLEAIRDRGDAAWTGSGGSGGR